MTICHVEAVIPDETDRVIFFGSGAYFSTLVLQQLIDLHCTPCALVIPEYAPAPTPDPPIIQWQQTTVTQPIHAIARQLQLPLIHAPVAAQNIAQELSIHAPHFILVACWPYRLSASVCAIASKAALNLHPSLLPKYRGANPLREQELLDDTQYGVSLHLMNATFDSGDIVQQSKLSGSGMKLPRKEIEQQAADIGTRLFIQAMLDFGSHRWQPTPQ